MRESAVRERGGGMEGDGMGGRKGKNCLSENSASCLFAPFVCTAYLAASRGNAGHSSLRRLTRGISLWIFQNTPRAWL